MRLCQLALNLIECVLECNATFTPSLVMITLLNIHECRVEFPQLRDNGYNRYSQ